jgi:hypothetical protein
MNELCVMIKYHRKVKHSSKIQTENYTLKRDINGMFGLGEMLAQC